MSPITRCGKIRANHPVREEFAGCTTGSYHGWGRTCYYSTKSRAINAFDGVLQTYDLCLDRDDLIDFHGDDGRKTIAVCDEFDNTVGLAVFAWHRMDHSGHYEWTGYLV